MEMISAKSAYIGSMAGYDDAIETIKNQIIQIIQLANVEGKFNATYYIENCPTEILTWLAEYGYSVVTEESYIVIDWNNAYLAQAASADIVYNEVEVDHDPDETEIEEISEETSQNSETIYHSGLTEIYINGDVFQNEGPFAGYTVDRIIVAGCEPTLVLTDQAEGIYQTKYNSYLKIYFSRTVDDVEQMATATIWFAEQAPSKTGIDGSLTALYQQAGQVNDLTNVNIILVDENAEEDTEVIGTLDHVYYYFDVGSDGSPYNIENPYVVNRALARQIHQLGTSINSNINIFLNPPQEETSGDDEEENNDEDLNE